MTVIKVIKNFLKNHYYAIGFFAFLWIYAIAVVGKFKPWDIYDVVYAFHAVDYSMGFASKILVGAVYQFFFGEINRETMIVFDKIVLCIIFAVSSVLLEKLMLHTEEKHRKTAFFILMFFLTGTPTFTAYVFALGMMDTFFVVFALLFIIFLSYKYSRWFLIVPLIGVVMVHYASMICFAPAMVLLALYKISCIDKKSEKTVLWISLSIGFAAMMVLFIYLLFYEVDNIKYTYEEFIEIMKARGVEQHDYYASAFFRKAYSTPERYENVIDVEGEVGLSKFFALLIQQAQITFELLKAHNGIRVFIMLLPLSWFLFKFLYNQAKENKENKLKVFTFICMGLLFFATLICAPFVSADSVRWVDHSLFILFSEVLYILYHEGSKAWDYVEREFSKTPVVLLVMYFLVYANTVDCPYT